MAWTLNPPSGIMESIQVREAAYNCHWIGVFEATDLILAVTAPRVDYLVLGG